MRGNDLIFAFPSLVIAILITAALGPSAVNAIIAIGIFNIPVFARVTPRRGAADLDAGLYPRGTGGGQGATLISLQHVLPNVANLLIVQATIQFSLGIPGRGGPVLCRPWRAAADAKLGPDAGRGADHVRPCAPCRHRARPCHRADRAGPEPAGRRPARCAGPAPAPKGPAMIETRDLAVSLGALDILRDVDLRLMPGQITGLVGESGSGKSMAALSIIGLLPAEMHPEGRVDLDGKNLLTMTETALCRIRGKRIGMIFQEPMTALNPLMNIGDQVAEVPAHPSGPWPGCRAGARPRPAGPRRAGRAALR